MDERFTLQAGAAQAVFSARGAECRAWRIGGRELLWPGDASVWDAIAPILFPTCGWSAEGRIRIGDATYPMPVHGFAAASAFETETISPQALRFTLRDGPETRRHYPYAFELAIQYTLGEDTLAIEIAVDNTGDAAMPYACGLHPGFALGAGAHAVTFAQDERADVPVIAPGGLVSRRRRPVPMQGRRLDLTPDLFAAEALCFFDARSRSFTYETPDGLLNVDAPDFPHLVLWSRPPAPFLCIESWTGTGDPEGFDGDFRDRPSMIHLAPGASRIHRARWRWQALGSGGASP